MPFSRSPALTPSPSLPPRLLKSQYTAPTSAGLSYLSTDRQNQTRLQDLSKLAFSGRVWHETFSKTDTKPDCFLQYIYNQLTSG
jgi:hypothetical protein